MSDDLLTALTIPAARRAPEHRATIVDALAGRAAFQGWPPHAVAAVASSAGVRRVSARTSNAFVFRCVARARSGGNGAVEGRWAGCCGGPGVVGRRNGPVWPA